MDQTYNYVHSVDNPRAFIKDALNRSQSRLRTVLQKQTRQSAFAVTKERQKSLQQKASYFNRRSFDEQALHSQPTPKALIWNDSIQQLEGVYNINSGREQPSYLREDLKKIKFEHMVKNLKAQALHQKRLFKRGQMTPQEKFDFNCHTREIGLKTKPSPRRHEQFKSTSAIIQEENPKDERTQKEISQVNNIKEMSDQMLARENEDSADKINGKGMSVAQDTKQIVKDYFSMLKPVKAKFKSISASQDLPQLTRVSQKHSHYESQRQFLRQDSQYLQELRAVTGLYQSNIKSYSQYMNRQVPQVINSAITRSSLRQTRQQSDLGGVRAVLVAARLEKQRSQSQIM